MESSYLHQPILSEKNGILFLLSLVDFYIILCGSLTKELHKFLGHFRCFDQWVELLAWVQLVAFYSKLEDSLAFDDCPQKYQPKHFSSKDNKLMPTSPSEWNWLDQKLCGAVSTPGSVVRARGVKRGHLPQQLHQRVLMTALPLTVLPEEDALTAAAALCFHSICLVGAPSSCFLSWGASIGRGMGHEAAPPLGELYAVQGQGSHFWIVPRGGGAGTFANLPWFLWRLPHKGAAPSKQHLYMKRNRRSWSHQSLFLWREPESDVIMSHDIPTKSWGF